MRFCPVLLPGMMCDARLWPADVRAVFPAAYDADLTYDDSIAAMAARTLAATSGPLLAIGFSMGAIVAAEMWVQAPERIAALVLLGYNATADLPTRAAHRPVQQAEVRSGGLERVLIEELKPHYLGSRHRTDEPLLALLRDMGLALGPKAFVQQSEALRLRADRVATLPSIGVPVFYGCGSEDALCPPAWHRRWELLTPDARFAEFGGTGHMLPLEAPDALAATLSAWLDEKDLR